MQSARYIIQRIGHNFRDANYFIVIRCKTKPWYQPDPNEHNQQYAIVVTIEQENNNRLYEEIEIHLQERVLNRNEV
jgi:hypothetical protein